MLDILTCSKNFSIFVDNQNYPFCEVVKIRNGPHHCVPLVEMVKKHKCPIRSPDEGVMPPGRYAPPLEVPTRVRTSGQPEKTYSGGAWGYTHVGSPDGGQ
jgi:hypothetical protein